MLAPDDLKRLLETLELKQKFVSEMQEVFFRAMNTGYAATEKPKKSTIAELPGSKLIPPYIRGPWKVTDVYHVMPFSTVSGGTTMISHEEVPVWMMQYFGKYEKDAIPCLKAALRDAYSKKIFYGGRGEGLFLQGEFPYWNTPSPIRFEEFAGDEHVTRQTEKSGTFVLGRHRYHGGIMF